MHNTCIDIEVRRVGEPLAFGSRRLGEGLGISALRVNEPLQLQTARQSEPLAFATSRNGNPLEFRCGLVCTLSQANYLRVEPQTIWLLPENDFSADVVVYANVTWRIE